jgi:hypothetical protein
MPFFVVIKILFSILQHSTLLQPNHQRDIQADQPNQQEARSMLDYEFTDPITEQDGR